VLTEENFEHEVLQTSTETLVLVEFGAPWNQHSKLLLPELRRVAFDEKEHVKVGRVNTDDYPKLRKEQKIQELPTLVFYKQNKTVHRIEGFATRAILKLTISHLLTGKPALEDLK
jgi:thioredoxin-like negative regulator of GroEL